MEFANLISTLRQEKEERALERGQRDKAIKKKAADLLRSLQQGIEVHRIDRAKASADHQDVAAMIVERGGESIKVVVVAPDKFSITRYMGAEDCKTLTFADEDETMRAIGLWLCPDLKDLSASEHQDWRHRATQYRLTRARGNGGDELEARPDSALGGGYLCLARSRDLFVGR